MHEASGLKLFQWKPLTSTKSIQALRTIFTRWGLPEQIVSDNGSQFTNTEFQKFCKVNGVQHIPVAAYHPRSNGEAEHFVKSLKHELKTSKEENILKVGAVFVLLQDHFTFNYWLSTFITIGWPSTSR